jgi:hypothetical protein
MLISPMVTAIIAMIMMIRFGHVSLDGGRLAS